MDKLMEYIDRTALIEKIKAICCAGCDTYNKVRCRACLISDALDCIADAPAVDVAPVVHGAWILKHVGRGHYWECSVCHTNPCIYVTNDTKICPNCGAKMDEEEKHDPKG